MEVTFVKCVLAFEKNCNSNFLIKVTFENGVDSKSEKIYRRLSLPTTADTHTQTENIRYDRVG